MVKYEYKTKPYQHQIDSLNYGLDHERFLLCDEQGLGKTKSVIDIACCLKQNINYTHCLIICGVNGLKWNWQEEVRTHSNESSYIIGQREKKGVLKIGSNQDKLDDLNNIDNLPFFLITNVESLRYKVKTGKKVRKRVGGHYTLVDEYAYPITDALVQLCNENRIQMIAADEVHKMKNPESEQGQQFLRLQAETEIAMTGTPIMNSPIDLYIILKWLGYEDHSFYQFKSHFCRLGGYGGYEVIGYKNLDQLQSTLDKIMLRRLKKDVLDLPDKVYINEYVDILPQQQKVYNDVHKELSSNIDMIVQSVNPLSQLIRLRQATGYPGILSSTIHESAKINRLLDLTEDIVSAGEKVIIFSNWTSMTDVLKEELKKYHPAVITGDTKDFERQEQVRMFQEDKAVKVIIGTIGAMGTGLTLTAANNVIFLDEPWNRALREQAEDRVHRIGQNKSVNIIFLITKGTIDERIHQIVEQKGEMADCIIDNKLTDDTIRFLLS